MMSTFSPFSQPLTANSTIFDIFCLMASLPKILLKFKIKFFQKKKQDHFHTPLLYIYIRMKYKGVPIQSISLFSTTSIYLELLLLSVQDLLASLRKFIVKRRIAIFLAAVAWLLVAYVPVLQKIEDILYFVAYWIILGVASSIGLGTGLHTFVLYLGPHIAKVAIASTHCGYVPEMIPSRWNFDHFDDCQEHSGSAIGILGILFAVQIQSFLWGLGTALGELPPYFVAYKASQTRAELKRMSDEAEGHPHKIDKKQQQLIDKEKKEHHLSSEEIEEVLQLKRKQKKTFMEKAKIIIYDNMQKYGFGTILACASIPNPLFDLAGITCGHFRIPFRTFFTATFIGKAIIKVHIQMIFVISIFRKESLEWIINLLSSISQGLAETAAKGFEEQKKILYEPSKFTENKPLVARLWDVFIIGMIAFFLKSIVDAQIQEKAIEMSTNNAVHRHTE